jgi:adenylate cyclase class IV
MAKELKVRINKYVVVEAKLMQLSAKYMGESSFVDTYYTQPEGHVLKIIEDKDGNSLLQLKAVDGKFDVVKREAIENVEEKKKQLSKEFGVKKVLSGKRISYQLDTNRITLCIIDDVGEFLILTSDHPKEKVITDILGIQNPEYIRVPFDEVESTKKV